MEKDDVLIINDESLLGKQNDVQNRDWYLIVDAVSKSNRKYVFCSQTKRDSNNKPIRDNETLEVVLLLDKSDLNKAYCIARPVEAIGDGSGEDEVIKENPKEFYTVCRH
jgi:hypothetical protein